MAYFVMAKKNKPASSSNFIYEKRLVGLNLVSVKSL